MVFSTTKTKFVRTAPRYIYLSVNNNNNKNNLMIIIINNWRLKFVIYDLSEIKLKKKK